MNNRISLGGGSFKDFVEKQASANEDKLVKTAGELPEALKEHMFGKKDKDDDKGEEAVDSDADSKDDDDKEAASDEVVKEAADKDEAESSGQLDVEPLHQEGDQTAEGEEKKAKSGGKADNSEGESSGQLDVEPLHQKGESTGDKPGGLETLKSEESGKFEKVAALSSGNRKFLNDYLPMVWPAAYVEQMLAEH